MAAQETQSIRLTRSNLKTLHDKLLMRLFQTAPAVAYVWQDQQRPEPVALVGRPSVGCAKIAGKWIDFISQMSGFHAALNEGDQNAS
jgi:hypothetical protein